LACDTERHLHDTLHRQFSGPIRMLIENRYVFEPFWKALRDHDASDRWERQFADGKRIALRAVLDQDTATVLSVVLDRLYVLRNQLVHGGATWRSGANRNQVGDGARILGALVPVIVAVMMESRDTDFGGIAFPWLPG
jgi:hypothetical protein